MSDFRYPISDTAKNRAILRVPLATLADLFRDGAHAYGLTGALPFGARLVHVETDHERGEARLFVETDTPSEAIRIVQCGCIAEEMRPILHTLGMDGATFRNQGE